MAAKLTVAVVFGGRSAEHEVSLVSAASIIKNLDRKKFRVVPVGITHEGRWIAEPDALSLLKGGRIPRTAREALPLPDPTRPGLYIVHGKGKGTRITIDVIFPIVHGTYGEDGTIQGLFEFANIPFVGAGVLGSSAGMDKITTKQLCQQAGITVTPYLWFLSGDLRKGERAQIGAIESKLGYPCFVKPANMGSSVGISKAHNRSELRKAFRLAARYDRRILVEKGIQSPCEVEVSVIGNDKPLASVPGEIISSNEFYDYEAKYVDGKSESNIPARLPASLIRKIRVAAVASYRAVECAGMARVDFLVDRRTGTIYLNELNTIPGFTSISMFPKLWEASGLSYRDLLTRLISLAMQRHASRNRLDTFSHIRSDWYRK
jgi:D-alanine-D-alanine ligase